MQHNRQDRVAEQIRAELAELIENEVADPRVGSVSVSGIHLSPDGKQVRVGITPHDPEANEKQCLQGLESARPFLRRELAMRLQLRYTPDLKFVIDHGPQHAERVESLLNRIKKKTPLAVVLLAVCASARGEMLRYESSGQAMGSLFTVAVYGEDRTQMTAAVEAALQEARRLDDLLSNYKAESELSQINRQAAQKPVKVSVEIFDLLEKCQQYSRASDGAFDWTVGPLMRVWGFYKGSGRLPRREEVAEAMKSVGYNHVHLDRENRTVRFDREGVELDPGGIGKGYAVDRMVDVLRDAGIEIALVSAAGSSIYALGAPPGEKGWYIRIRDPKSEDVTAAEVWLKDQSLSTSGTYEKFFEADGKIYSHLMDPRTGYPAQGMLEVSVLAPKTLDSEAWTKPYFINGAAWSKEHLQKSFRVLLCEDGKPCYWLP